MKRIVEVSFEKYSDIHSWIRKNYGKADHCCHITEGVIHSTNYDWAIKGFKPYTYNINNFIQLCHKCHINYDSKWANKDSFLLKEETYQKV